jgi:hypothetical protein
LPQPQRFGTPNNGNDDRPLVVLYIGDYDPSGMCMSERDLPERIAEYGGDHIEFIRIALTAEQTASLPSFSVEDKKNDKRYAWFKKTYGGRCWELDAMDPRLLRDLVEAEIKELIDQELWEEQEALEKREKESLEGHLHSWMAVQSRPEIAKADLQISPAPEPALNGVSSGAWGLV